MPLLPTRRVTLYVNYTGGIWFPGIVGFISQIRNLTANTDKEIIMHPDPILVKYGSKNRFGQIRLRVAVLRIARPSYSFINEQL